MAVFVNTFFEARLANLFALAEVVAQAFAAAGLDYRVVGGLATYLYVEEKEAGSRKTLTSSYAARILKAL